MKNPFNRHSPASLALSLLRAAAMAQPEALAAALDAGAPIDAPLKPNSKARACLPAHLAAHQAWLPAEGTALSICGLIATDPHGQPDQMIRAMLCAKVLIERGANPGGRGPKTSSPASVAVDQALRGSPTLDPLRQSHLSELLSWLAKAGADLDAPDPRGSTPLWLCLINEKLESARFLTSLGADIDKRDPDGQSIAWLLSSSGKARALPLALALGADPNLADSQGRTPLWAALNSTAFASAKISCVRTLLKHGATLDREAIPMISKGPMAKFFAADIARAEAQEIERTTPAAEDSPPKGARL